MPNENFIGHCSLRIDGNAPCPEAGAPRTSLRVRIRAEPLDVAALLLQMRNGLGDLLVMNMAVAINEEEIFPRLPLAGAGFDLGHVDAITPERGQRVVQRADLVRDADHQARAVLARGRT